MARVLIEGNLCERYLHRWAPKQPNTPELKNCPKCKSPLLEQATANAGPRQTGLAYRWRMTSNGVNTEGYSQKKAKH